MFSQFPLCSKRTKPSDERTAEKIQTCINLPVVRCIFY